MVYRNGVVAAFAALIGATLLLGGASTDASWTDSTGSGTTQITAGTLSAAITQEGPAAVEIGEPSPGVYPDPDSQGLIPGVQGQQWNYTLENSAGSAVAADAVLRLTGGPYNPNEYWEFLPYLRATVQVDGRDAVDIPIESFTEFGFAFDLDMGARLQPGETIGVTLTVYMPSTIDSGEDGVVDVGFVLRHLRSADGIDAYPVLTMENSVYLRQAGAQ